MGYNDELDREIPIPSTESSVSDTEYNDILGIEENENPESNEEDLPEEIDLAEEDENPTSKKKKARKKNKVTETVLQNNDSNQTIDVNGASPLRQPNYTNHVSTPQESSYGQVENTPIDSPDLDLHGVHVIGIDSIENLEDAAINGDLTGVSFGDASSEEGETVVTPVHAPKGYTQPLSKFENISYATNGKMEDLYSGFGPIAPIDRNDPSLPQTTEQINTHIDQTTYHNETTGEEVPYLANGATFNNTYKSEFATATSIVFAEDTTNIPTDTKTVDLSADQSGRILAWQEGETMYVAPQSASLPLMANPDSSLMFANSENLLSIDFGSLKTDQVISMNSMLANCYDLKNINLESLNVSSVRDLSGILANCENIHKADISNWQLNDDVEIISAFSKCPAVNQETVETLWSQNAKQDSIPVSSLFEGYRYDLTAPISVDAIHPVNIYEKVTVASESTTIVQPDLVDGRTSPDGTPYVMRGAEFNVLFKQEFNDATEVVFSSGKPAPKDTKTIDITADNSGRILMWKEEGTVHISTTSENVKPLANPDSSNMFSGLFALQKIDFGTFDSSRTRDMANMFANSINLSSINTEKLKLDLTTDISGMFMNLSNMEKLNVANWNTDNVRYMIGTFKGTGVTDIDVSKWKTSKVVDMTGTFAEMKNIQQLNLSSWDVSNVKAMNYMFANNDQLITLANKGWQTTKVEQMNNMFLGNKSLINFDPASLKTDSLLSMNGIFIGANSLNRKHATEWIEKSSIAIEKNSLTANAREILRKMTPEEMTKFALELEAKNIAKENCEPSHIIEFAKKNNIGPYKETKDPSGKSPSSKTEKGSANTPAGIESPFAKAKEDDIDKIVNQRQKYKFVTEREHIYRHTFTRSGQKLGNAAKSIVTNNLYDDDQYKVATNVREASRTISSVIIASGAHSIFTKAKNIAKDTHFAAFITDKLIQDGVLTVGDLKKSKKEFKETITEGLQRGKISLSKKEIESILRNRNKTYDLYMVRQNINERIELGQFSQMSDATKRTLKDTRFTNLYSKEMHEAISTYGRTSKNPVMKRIDALSNKDINKILKNAEKYGLTETDKSVLRLKKAQNKLRKARLSKPKLMSNLFSAFRLLSDLRRKSDSTFAEGASILFSSVGIASSTKSVVFAGVKAGRYGIKLIARGGKKFVRFIDRITGASTIMRKGTRALGHVAVNSAPGKAITKTVHKGVTKVQESKVGKATKSSADRLKKHKDKVREKRRQKAAEVAEKKAAAAVARLQASAAVRRIMNTKVGRAVSLPFRIIAIPFKGLGAASRAISAVVKGAQKLIYGALSAVGIFIICYMLIVLILSGLLAVFENDSEVRSSVMSSFTGANQSSSKSMTKDEIEALEAEEHSTLQTLYTSSKQYQEGLLVTANAVARGTPLHPTVYCGHTISRYGSPSLSGSWTPGYTIRYSNADDDIVVATIDNTKDALVMAYIIMGDKFFTDSAGRDALVEAFYKYMNPEPKYEESSIFYCPSGCSSMSYHCDSYSEYSSILTNDTNGMSAYSSYSYNSNGDYYTTSCNGHTCTSSESGETSSYYHSGGYNSAPSYYGTITISFSDGSSTTFSPGSCGNYTTTSHCNGHSVPVCYGHKNITITIQKRTMYDLFEDGYSLPSNSAYNSYISSFDGWTEEYKTWADKLKGADWNELYGVGN